MSVPQIDFRNFAGSLLAGFKLVLERLSTFGYHEMLQRNTIQPLLKIITAPDDEDRVRLLRDWSRLKVEESKYIQLAGGFLFTTAATGLTWTGIDKAHWSGSALFFASIVFALVAIVSGSQQLWILHRVANDQPMPQEEKQKLTTELAMVLGRFQRPEDPMKLKSKYVFALQGPILLLTLAVVTFLAAVCSVVYSPVARLMEWNDDAKIALMFTIASVLAGIVFVTTSTLIYGLFRSDAND